MHMTVSIVITGFPTGVEDMGGGALQNLMGWLKSIYGGAWGA